MRIVRRRRSVAQRIESMLLCKPGFEFGDDGYTRAKLARQGVKTPHPNDMLAMLAGTRCPYSSTAYCSPCKGGTYAANATSCASCPEGYYCSGAAPLPEICQDVSSYCPAGSSAPIIAKAGTYTNPKRTATSACEEGFTARADVASSAHRDLTALLEYQTTSSSRGHVHKRKSNKRVSVRGKLLLR